MRALAVPVAGGLLVVAAMPPFDVVAGVPAGLTLLALALRRAASARAAFAAALAWAAVAGAGGMRWVPVVVERFTDSGAVPAVVALGAVAVGQALAWGGGALLAQALHRRAGVPFEVAFAGGVLLACSVPAVFPWTPAGLLAGRPELLQLAELVGERGVSVLLAVACALVVRAGLAAAAVAAPADRLRAAAAPAVAALALLGGLEVYGAARMRAVLDAPGAARLRVALVDHGAGARERDDPARQAPLIARLRSLSARADSAGAQLVVWPEAAYPVPLDRATRRVEGGTASPLSPGARAPRLIGLTTYARKPDGDGADQYNSATLVLPDGRVERPVDKLRLLWFGETVPLGGVIPPLRNWFARSSDVEPGTEARALLLPRPGAPVRVGVLNCYEDLHAGSGRRLWAGARPQVLVSLVNNAWFAGTAAPALHERLTVARAIELRTDVVRAVNGGGGGWIDAAGRVRARSSASPGLTMVAPAVREPGGAATVYARAGDAPLWVLLGIVAIAAAGLRRRRVAHGRAVEPAACPHRRLGPA